MTPAKWHEGGGPEAAALAVSSGGRRGPAPGYSSVSGGSAITPSGSAM